MHGELIKEKMVQMKQFFQHNLKKAETFLSHPNLFQCGTDHLPLRIWFLSSWWKADPCSTQLKGKNKQQDKTCPNNKTTRERNNQYQLGTKEM